MSIRLRQALLSAAVSVCAVWVSGCLDNSLNAALSEKLKPDVPTDVSASAKSSNSIEVHWPSLSGVMGYRVYRSTAYAGDYVLVGSAPFESMPYMSYIDDNLSSNTAYYYKVSACNSSGESPQSPYCTARTRLDVPKNISAVATSSSSIRVSWSPVGGASGYRVYRGASSNGAYNQVESTSSTSYTDNNRSSNTSYYYKVSAYSGATESLLSDYVFARTDLNAPENVSESSSANSITISWSPVGGAAGYRVERSVGASVSYTSLATTSSTSYRDENVSPGQTYNYRIFAYDGTAESSQYSAISATIGLNTPTGVFANSSASSITVSWSPVGGAAGYHVERSSSGSSGPYSEVGIAPSASYTDNNVSPGVSYHYRISAYNGTMSSPYSTPIPATVGLSPPSSIGAYALSSSRIAVVWSPVGGATGYSVERSGTYSDGYTTVWWDYNSSSTLFTDNGVSPGATYYYRVSAHIGASKSAPSSTVYATTAVSDD